MENMKKKKTKGTCKEIKIYMICDELTVEIKLY